MSDFLSTALPILSALTGGIVVLDTMVLLDFEVPERISYGGQQQMTVHKMPGGGRVFDKMGPDPSPIQWQGIFLGFTAALRRTQMDAIRVAGEPVLLAWGDQVLTVMVMSIDFDEGFHQIGYRIRCEVVPDVADDSEQDDAAYGDGETPSTPAAAKDAGQADVSAARTAAKPIPVRAVSTTGAFDLPGTTFQ